MSELAEEVCEVRLQICLLERVLHRVRVAFLIVPVVTLFVCTCGESIRQGLSRPPRCSPPVPPTCHWSHLGSALQGGLAGGLGLHDVRQLFDDQLQGLDQQRNVGPALRVLGRLGAGAGALVQAVDLLPLHADVLQPLVIRVDAMLEQLTQRHRAGEEEPERADQLPPRSAPQGDGQ